METKKNEQMNPPTYNQVINSLNAYEVYINPGFNPDLYEPNFPENVNPPNPITQNPTESPNIPQNPSTSFSLPQYPGEPYQKPNHYGPQPAYQYNLPHGVNPTTAPMSPGQYLRPTEAYKEPGGQYKEPDGAYKESDGQDKESDGQDKESDGQDKESDGQDKESDGQNMGPPGQDTGPTGQDTGPPGQDTGPPGQDTGPPGQNMGPPGQAASSNAHTNQVSVVSSVNRPKVLKVSCSSPIILACLVIILGCNIFGYIALILALIGQKKLESRDFLGAKRLKSASYVISNIGLFLSLILIYILPMAFVLAVSSNSNNTQSSSDDNFDH